ncbi:Vacuolar protein [Dirofilaria immitis]
MVFKWQFLCIQWYVGYIVCFSSIFKTHYGLHVMVDVSYESLLDVCVSAAMTSVRNMNYDHIGELLDNDGEKKIDDIIDNISQVRTLPTEREMGLVQNKSLAEWNLSQEPKIEEAKRRLRNTYEEAVKVKEEVIRLKGKLNSLSEERSLDTSSALLQAAAQTADDESEAIADRYLNGEIEVDQFLKEFIEKKTLAHMRKIKSEKLLAILRQQQYPQQPSSNFRGIPYPTKGGLYPQPVNLPSSRQSFCTSGIALAIRRTKDTACAPPDNPGDAVQKNQPARQTSPSSEGSREHEISAPLQAIAALLFLLNSSMKLLKLQRVIGTAAIQQIREVSLRAKVKKVDPWQLYEPAIKNEKIYPEYPLLTLQLDSMDFVPLEKFHSYTHRKARQFEFKVVDSYAIPPTKILLIPEKLDKRKQEKNLVLSTFHRFLRLGEVPSVRLSLYLYLIQAHAPVGITIKIKKQEQIDEDIRYIPDEILEARKAELISLDDPKTRKLLGWE